MKHSHSGDAIIDTDKGRCPNCGYPVPANQAFEQARRWLRDQLIPVSGITILTLVSVAVSFTLVYQRIGTLTTTINGDIATRTDSLQQAVGNIENTMYGDVTSQVDQLQQSIDAYKVGALGTPLPISIRFTCYDSATNEILSDCFLQIQILDETPLYQFEIGSSDSVPITVPMMRRLEVTAQSDGYVEESVAFEYIENGTVQSRRIGLEEIQGQ